jgi:hypothetical protein
MDKFEITLEELEQLCNEFGLELTKQYGHSFTNVYVKLPESEIWNKDTIDRILSSYSDKITIGGEKVSVREYIQANESELKSDLEWLDRTTSMDYHLPEIALEVLPSFVQ